MIERANAFHESLIDANTPPPSQQVTRAFFLDVWDHIDAGVGRSRSVAPLYRGNRRAVMKFPLTSARSTFAGRTRSNPPIRSCPRGTEAPASSLDMEGIENRNAETGRIQAHCQTLAYPLEIVHGGSPIGLPSVGPKIHVVGSRPGVHIKARVSGSVFPSTLRLSSHTPPPTKVGILTAWRDGNGKGEELWVSLPLHHM